VKLHAPILLLAVCMAAGIALSQWVAPWYSVLWGLVPLVFATALMRRRPRWQTVGVHLCALLVGMLVGGFQQQAAPAESLFFSRVQGLFLYWREGLLDRYAQWGIGGDAYGVVAAMTLGDKSYLTDEVKETFAQTGAAHVLALSGMHLMIVYSAVTLLFGWQRFRLLAQGLMVCSVWAFAFLVGMSASVTRAAFMLTVYAALSLGHRERMSVNTLAFAAVVMLAVSPASLRSVSFQLSFMAVLAILLFNPLLQRLVPRRLLRRHRWLRLLWGMTTVSLSAQLGTAPLVAYYFDRFSTYFLLSNYIVIPLATLVLYLTLACVAVSWSSLLAGALVPLLVGTVTLMSRLLAWVSRLPGSSIEDIGLPLAAVYLIYIIMGSVWVTVTLFFPRYRRRGRLR